MGLELLLYSEADQAVDNAIVSYLREVPLLQEVEIYYVNQKKYQVIHDFLPDCIEINDHFIYRLGDILNNYPTILVVEREIKRFNPRYITYSIASPLIYYDGSLHKYQPFVLLSWKLLCKYQYSFDALEFFLLHELGHLLGLVPNRARNLIDRYHHCVHKHCVMYPINMSRYGDEHINYIKEVNPYFYCKEDYKRLQKRISKINNLKFSLSSSSFFSFWGSVW